MPFQRVLRKFKSTPILKQEPAETIERSEPIIDAPKPHETPTFPRRIPSIPLFLKRNHPVLTDERYEQEVDDLISLIDVMLDDSL